MAYIGTKPGNQVVDGSLIADGTITTADLASGLTVNFADGSASTPSITNDGDTNTGIFFPAADTIAFAEGGAEVARFDANGNLGVGTSSPNFNGGTGTVCHINNNGTSAAWAISHYTNGSTGSGTADGLIAGVVGADAYVFNYDPSPIIFGTNAAERMRIDSSGRVLIGVSSASSSMGTRLGGLQSGSGFIMGSEFFAGGGNKVITFNSNFNYFIELTVTAWGNGSTTIHQGKFIAGRRDWTGSPHANNYADQIGTAVDVAVSFTDNSPSTNFRSYTLTFTNNSDSANNHWMVEYKLYNINNFNIA